MRHHRHVDAGVTEERRMLSHDFRPAAERRMTEDIRHAHEGIR